MKQLKVYKPNEVQDQVKQYQQWVETKLCKTKSCKWGSNHDFNLQVIPSACCYMVITNQQPNWLDVSKE